MDKKAKKRIEVLRKKIVNLQQKLSGAKQQMDDPEEVTSLQADLDAAHAQIKELQKS